MAIPLKQALTHFIIFNFFSLFLNIPPPIAAHQVPPRVVATSDLIVKAAPNRLRARLD